MVGDRIRKRRERLGMTQAQLEEITGIGHRMISNYEKGSSKPNDEIINTLMAALKCDANYLFGFSDTVESDIISDKKSPLSVFTENEQQIIDLFRLLTETQQGELIGRAKVMAEQNEALYKKEDIG